MQNEDNKYRRLCQNAAKARGVYSAMCMDAEEIEKRFWSKVKIGDRDECWPWMAGTVHFGYGSFRAMNRKHVSSRFAWECANGDIPQGLYVCHKCDNPKCCNPAHLFLGTAKQNAEDCARKGRLHISKGVNHPMHKLTEEDVFTMRCKSSSGQSNRELADTYGVAISTVKAIVKRRLWAHIG